MASPDIFLNKVKKNISLLDCWLDYTYIIHTLTQSYVNKKTVMQIGNRVESLKFI